MMRLFIKSAILLISIYCVVGSQYPTKTCSEKKFLIVLEEFADNGTCDYKTGWRITDNFTSLLILNWFDSLRFCSSHNMNLTTIVSQQEQDIVKNLIKEHGKKDYARYWLGAALFHQDFVWISNGESLKYRNFGPDEPNGNSTTLQEYCLELNVGNVTKKDLFWNFEWNDVLCHRTNYFICEYFN